MIYRTAGEGGDHLLFHSTTSTRLRTFRHLFATLHVRWLSHIFNRNACVYQTATRWDLPHYWITIWVIDWWCNVCLFTWWINTRFLLQRFDIGNRWIWNRIDYHPCIRSKPTNQVCYSPPKFLRNSCNSWAITLKTHPSSNSHSESQESFSSLDDRCWIRPSSIWSILLSSCSTDGSTTNKRVQWLQTIFSIFKCLRNICSAPATWNILFLFRCGHVIVEINKSFRMNWF